MQEGVYKKWKEWEGTGTHSPFWPVSVLVLYLGCRTILRGYFDLFLVLIKNLSLGSVLFQPISSQLEQPYWDRFRWQQIWCHGNQGQTEWEIWSRRQGRLLLYFTLKDCTDLCLKLSLYIGTWTLKWFKLLKHCPVIMWFLNYQPSQTLDVNIHVGAKLNTQ